MSRGQIPTLIQSDPLRIAWLNLGMDWAFTPDGNQIDSCGRCQLIKPLEAYKNIISNNFTGWGNINPSSYGLCDSCAWGYRDPRLRTNAIIVHVEGSAFLATPDQLKILLSMSLSPDVCISIPYSGKKHLLPSAEWGMVVSDDGCLAWRSTEAHLINIISRLRPFGVYESEFMEPAPPYRAVAAIAQDTDGMIELLDLWAELRLWQNGPHIKLAIRATRSSFVEESSSKTIIITEEE